MHPSCIKMPATKDASLDIVSSIKETEIRDQLCTKNDLITIANETFGNDKWSHTITNQTLDFVEYVTGKYYVGCAAFVKVQLSNGSVHEDLGYSNSEGSNKGLTIFSARTGSITNALKNALLSFGGEIAIKLKNVTKQKAEESSSVISAIGEPQKITSKPRIAPPQAQSTPQKTRPSSMSVAPDTLENNEQSKPPVNNDEEKLRSPACLKPVENLAQIDKPALSEEEKRLERKRKQAQKQAEYKKLLKEMESAGKQNPRF